MLSTMAHRVLAAVAAGSLALAGCAAPSPVPGVQPGSGPVSDGAPSARAPSARAPSGTIHLYTSVTQDTVDAVLAAYRTAEPNVTVDVFRAPTGQLDARIASEQRSGGIGADVLWGTDPLSVQAYAAQGLFRTWAPADAAAVPDAYHTDTFWGTRILDLVIVYPAGFAAPPRDWHDLTTSAFSGSVVIPDPGFSGSAFGALGYFATADGYGIGFYRALKANGATQVEAIPQVVTDVAEGRYHAGITLAKVARDAIAKGSPLRITWPSSGAIAIYSPIAVFRDAQNAQAAESFASFVLSRAGQAAIAATGWQPIRSDVGGGPPVGGPQVGPDWQLLFSRQEALMQQYRAIFGG